MSSAATSTEVRVETDQYAKDVPWYSKKIEDLSPTCRELLENYSHIRPDEVERHVIEVRERAWASLPYPCIGRFMFLQLSMSLQPCYPRILSLLKDPKSQHTLLDLGCCFAQDVRKLVHDGVPSENLYACDVEQSFLDLSYDLFKDKGTMKAHLFAANVFDENGALDSLQGKIDVIYLGGFLHLFSWDDQLKICKKIINVLKPRKGSTVFGRHMGNLKAQEARNPPVGPISTAVWRHDVESFTRLWEVVGRETATKWKTWGMLDKGEGIGPVPFLEKGVRRLSFEVQRVE